VVTTMILLSIALRPDSGSPLSQILNQRGGETFSNSETLKQRF
jgi:hypothetical protein